MHLIVSLRLAQQYSVEITFFITRTSLNDFEGKILRGKCNSERNATSKIERQLARFSQMQIFYEKYS